MRDLAGKVAVITGGGSGIGAGLAQAFAEAGMSVLIADIELEAATSVAADLESRFAVRAMAVALDVAQPDSVEALAAQIYEAFGAVHLLCNNAGVMPVGPLLDMTIAEWRWLYDVNVFGVVNGIHAFVPRMLRSGQPGHVVNTASMASFSPSTTVAAYASSKHAVLALTESLRAELAGTTVGVSALCPGAVDTRIADSERNRPADSGPPSGRVIPQSIDTEKAAAQSMQPIEVGRIVRDGISAGDFWIFTHPSWARQITTRFDEAATAARATLHRQSQP
jgi:NAD(P)-dependent dehydrogenase (short-subunit alcohol dehydrogenase family)